MEMHDFDPRQRAAEKAAARRVDDADLASGAVSHAALRQRNDAFGHLDFSRARIVLGDFDQVL